MKILLGVLPTTEALFSGSCLKCHWIFVLLSRVYQIGDFECIRRARRRNKASRNCWGFKEFFFFNFCNITSVFWWKFDENLHFKVESVRAYNAPKWVQCTGWELKSWCYLHMHVYKAQKKGVGIMKYPPFHEYGKEKVPRKHSSVDSNTFSNT